MSWSQNVLYLAVSLYLFLSFFPRLLQKCSLVQSAKVLERDTQRGELNKVKQGQAEVAYDMEGMREEIHKLTQQINLAEQQLNKVNMK